MQGKKSQSLLLIRIKDPIYPTKVLTPVINLYSCISRFNRKFNPPKNYIKIYKDRYKNCDKNYEICFKANQNKQTKNMMFSA